MRNAHKLKWTQSNGWQRESGVSTSASQRPPVDRLLFEETTKSTTAIDNVPISLWIVLPDRCGVSLEFDRVKIRSQLVS